MKVWEENQCGSLTTREFHFPALVSLIVNDEELNGWSRVQTGSRMRQLLLGGGGVGAVEGD